MSDRWTCTACGEVCEYEGPQHDCSALRERAERESAAKQSRLDAFACATLTGLLADTGYDEPSGQMVARIWALADAMESERSRRLEAQK